MSQPKTSRHLLAIDTTHPETVIGLGSKIESWESKHNQTHELLPRIDKLLKAQGLAAPKLQGIAVNVGPGSFTGLRVGVTTANGFGFGLGIPVVGINEFEIIRELFPEVGVIILNAGRREVFVASPTREPVMISIDKLPTLLKTGERVYLDDAALIPIAHEYLNKAGIIHLPHISREQRLAAMVGLAQTRLTKTRSDGAVPLYLRGANITKPRARVAATGRR